MTALMMASREGYKSVVPVLIEYGAQLDLQNNVRDATFSHTRISKNNDFMIVLLSSSHILLYCAAMLQEYTVIYCSWYVRLERRR